MGCAIVIAGASGSGKTSVAKGLIKRAPELYSLSRSATSRPMRDDDKGKNEYLFCSKEQFLSMIAEGDMIESTEYGGNYYGTPSSEFERIISEGKNAVLVLDMNGVQSFKSASLPFPVYTFYVYEHINEIERRLYERDLKVGGSLDALLSFCKRKEANIRDYLKAAEYSVYIDAYILNSDLDACIDSLEYCLRLFEGDSGEGNRPSGIALAPEEKRALVKELSRQAEAKLQ